MRKRLAALATIALALALVPAATAHGWVSLSLHPASWDFGARDPGAGPSDPATFTLTNTGDVAVVVYAAGVGWFGPVDSDPQLFLLENIGCFELPSLPPGGTCTVEVRFNPSTPGPKTGMVGLTGCHPSPLECKPGPVSAWADLAGSANGPYQPDALGPPAPPILIVRSRVALLHHPARVTRRRSAAFRFTGTGAVGYLCRLDAMPARPCRSPLRFRRLAVGRHRLVIRAIDASHRVGPPKRFRWRILR